MLATGTNNSWILGRCRYSQSNFSRLEPLLWSTGDAWTLVEDALAEFPEVGTVFGLEPIALNAAVGSLWVFTTATNTQYEPGRRHDRLLARGIRPATQIIDCSQMDMEAARRELVEVGICANGILSREVVVCLQNGLCAKLHLHFDSSSGRLRTQGSDLDDLALMRYDPVIGDGATLDGARFVVPGRDPTDSVEWVDWSPDNLFLERALKKIRKLIREDRPAADFVTLSTTAIEILSGYLHRNGPPFGTRDPLHRMRRRLSDFLPGFEATRDDVEAIVALLEDYRPVASRLSVDRTARLAEIDGELRQTLEPVVRADIESNHATAIADLERIRTAVTAATDRHTHLQREIETLRATERELIEAITNSVGVIHDVIEGAPGDTGGTLQTIVRAVTAVLGQKDARSNLVPGPIPPWGLGTRSEVVGIGFDRLRERLHAQAGHVGIDISGLSVIDVLLRAGELVVLCNPHDRLLLDAYADVVAGGSIRKQVLDPSLIGLDDLWRQPGSGIPTALANAWIAAQLHADRTIVLLLEGLDSAPLRWWLRALVRELHGTDRPGNLLVVATLDTSRVVSADDMNVMHGHAIPVVTERRPEAWMRGLLSATAGTPRELPTILDSRSEPSLGDDQPTALMSALAGLATVNADAALRALRVSRAAACTMDPDAGLRLATDIAALASAEMATAVTVTTPCIASGVAQLRETSSGSST